MSDPGVPDNTEDLPVGESDDVEAAAEFQKPGCPTGPGQGWCPGADHRQGQAAQWWPGSGPGATPVGQPPQRLTHWPSGGTSRPDG